MSPYFYLVNTPAGIELYQTASKSDLIRGLPRNSQILTGPFHSAVEAENTLPEATARQRMWSDSFMADKGADEIFYYRSVETADTFAPATDPPAAESKPVFDTVYDTIDLSF